MTLREGDREYFYEKLDKHFPGLKERYMTRYGNNYEVTSDNNRELMRYFLSTCAENNIVCDNGKLFEYMSNLDDKTAWEQPELF